MTRPAVPMLTEREARLAGITSTRLCSLRGALAATLKGATLSVQTVGGGTTHFPLLSEEGVALLALLRERDEAFLSGLNIELETAE